MVPEVMARLCCFWGLIGNDLYLLFDFEVMIDLVIACLFGIAFSRGLIDDDILINLIC